MSTIRTLSVNQLLWSAAGVVLAALVGIGLLGHLSNGRLLEAMTTVEDKLDVSRGITDLHQLAEEAQGTHLRYLLTGDQAALQEFAAVRADLADRIDELHDRIVTPALDDQLDEADRALGQVLDVMDQANQVRTAGDAGAAAGLSATADVDRAAALLAGMSEQQDVVVEEVEAAADDAAATTTTMQIGAIVLAAGLLLGLNTLVSRRMERAFADQRAAEERAADLARQEAEQAQDLRDRVDELLVVVRAAEGGDLTRTAEPRGDDAVARLGEGLAALLAQWRSNVATIDENATALADASARLLRFSEEVGSAAERTSRQAVSVAAASQQVTGNVTTVAAATEQMGSSIKEISRTCNDASTVAMSAVDAATATGERVGRLGESSSEIGQIIQMIGTIARQTNLLALNATIEAARAGDAGKGFAVVAYEVKELADRTAQASQEVTERIESIQGDTDSVVQSIGRIGAVINEINQLQSTIAAAVEEQSAVSAEMGQNTTYAAAGCTEISETIGGVADSAQQTSSVTASTATAAGELADMAGTLRTLVGRFTY